MRGVVTWGRKQKKFYGILYDSFEKLHCDPQGELWGHDTLVNITIETEAALEMLCDLILCGIDDPAREEALPLLGIFFNTGSRFAKSTCTFKVDGAEGKFAHSIQRADRTEYNFQARLINMFGERGCFDKINEEFLKLHDAGNLKAEQVIGHVAAFQNINPLISQECLKLYIIPWIKLGMELASSLDGNALKDASRYFVQNDETLNRFHLAISDAFGATTSEALQGDPLLKVAGDFMLQILLKLVKADNYNGVMHSLNLLLSLIQRAENVRSANMQLQQTGGAQLHKEGHLTVECLTEWLNENKVVKELLEDYMHNVQYVEKVSRVIKFLVHFNQLELDSLTAMWHAQVGKHEAIVTNVHKLLAGLAPFFTAEHLDHLLTCFRETWGGTPQNMQKSLELIGRLTKDDQEGHLAQKVLTLIWDLAHNVDTPTSIVEAALHSHLNILGGVGRADLCDNVLTMCREHLANNTWVVYATKHIRHVIKFYPRTERTVQMERGKTQIQQLPETRELINKFDLLNIGVTCLEKHMAAARTALAAQGAATAAHPEQLEVVLGSGFPHAQEVKERMAFIRWALDEGLLYLPLLQAEKMWNVLVVHGVCAWDQEFAFEEFTKMTANGDFEERHRASVMQKCVLVLPPATLSIGAFNCFKQFYVTERKLVLPKISGTKFNDAGVAYLKEVALGCNNEAISTLAIDLLKDLYLTIRESVPGLLRSVMHELIDTLLVDADKLAATADAAAQQQLATGITRSLELLNKVVRDADNAFGAVRSQLPHGASFKGQEFHLQVECRTAEVGDSMAAADASIVYTVTATSNQTVKSFKKAIQAAMDVADPIQIEINGAEIHNEMDSALLSTLGVNPTSKVEAISEYEDYDQNDADSASPTEYNRQAESDLPALVIAADTKRVEQIFKLTSLQKFEPVVRGATKLLTAIPTNLLALGELRKLVVASARGDISLFFTEKDPFALLYYVQMLCRLIRPADGTVAAAAADAADTGEGAGAGSGAAFTDQFVENGGIQLLLSLLKQGPDAGTAPIELQYRRDAIRIVLLLLRDLLWYGIDVAGRTGAEATHVRLAQSITRLAAVGEDWTKGFVEVLINLSWSAGTGRWQLGYTSFTTVPADGAVLTADRWLALDAIEVLCIGLKTQDELRQSMLANVGIRPFINNILLDSSDAHVRKAASDHLTMLVTDDATFGSMLDIGTSILAEVEMHAATSAEFFQFMAKLFSMTECRLDESTVNQVLKDQITWLEVRGQQRIGGSDAGKVHDTDDKLLAGRMLLCNALLLRDASKKPAVGDALIKVVVEEFLFPASKHLQTVRVGGDKPQRLPSDASGLPEMIGETNVAGGIAELATKSRSEAARHAAQQLLVTLASGCQANFEKIATSLNTLHFEADESRLAKFNCRPDVDARPPSGYVGLNNAGATCYVNSVLQQLYMQPAIRTGLLQCPQPEGDGANTNLLYHLQSGFASLQKSKMQAYTPKGFWDHYRHSDNTKINLREQRDAHDFFVELIDQLDTKLETQNVPKYLETWFGGAFADQKSAMANRENCCDDTFEREDPFISLQVNVRNRQKLEQSLEDYVQGDPLEGSNAYTCEKCDSKRDTLKRQCIKRLPRCLAIQLKRFDFDWERDEPVKFNDYFAFPEEIDMRPYTAVGLAEKEQGKAPAGVDNYVLVGVVVHTGQANGGHYYSFIRERSSCGKPTSPWMRFDDSEVSTPENFDPKQEWFGGTYQVSAYDTRSRQDVLKTKERWWNAYLLIYERVTDEEYPDDAAGIAAGQAAAAALNAQAAAAVVASGGGGGGGGGGAAASAPADGGATTAPPAPPSSFLMGPGSSRGGGRKKAEEPPVDGTVVAAAVKGDVVEAAMVTPLPPSDDDGSDVEIADAGGLPPLIWDVVADENLRFMHRREVFNKAYYAFMLKLCDCNLPLAPPGDADAAGPEVGGGAATSTLVAGSAGAAAAVAVPPALGTLSVKLACKFYFSFVLRTVKDIRGSMLKWNDLFGALLRHVPGAGTLILQHLSETPPMIQEVLLVANNRQCRHSFQKLLIAVAADAAMRKVPGSPFDELLPMETILIPMLESGEVGKHSRFFEQYFTLLSEYCALGPDYRAHLLSLDVVQKIYNMLFTNPQWAPQYAPDFTKPYEVISHLVRSRRQTHYPAEKRLSDNPYMQQDQDGVEEQTMPEEANRLLFSNSLVWDKMLELAPGSSEVAEMLRYYIFESTVLSKFLLGKWLRNWMQGCPGTSANGQYNAFMNVFYANQDSMQFTRIKLLLLGTDEPNTELGLLDFLNRLQVQRDLPMHSRRIYFSLKLLARWMDDYEEVRKYLLSEPVYDKWTWMVDWLDDEMEKLAPASYHQITTSNTKTKSTFIYRSESAIDLVDSFRSLGIPPAGDSEDDDSSQSDMVGGGDNNGSYNVDMHNQDHGGGSGYSDDDQMPN